MRAERTTNIGESEIFYKEQIEIKERKQHDE